MTVSSKRIWFCMQLLVLVCLAKANIINENVDRTIDISSQLVKEYIDITAEALDGKPIKAYTIAVPLVADEKLAYVSVKSGKIDLNFKNELKNAQHDIVVSFKTPKTKQKFNIQLIYTQGIVPHPKEIKQNEKQLVKYNGRALFYSPYKTKTQKTTLKLNTAGIISYTQQKPVSVNSNKIEYGPYQNTAELTKQPLEVHYENQTPFLTVKLLERNIEVSHWGNVAVKENIYLEHTGAKLKGPFSRYEFQEDRRTDKPSVKSYKTMLPASAADVYYRDSNGNISTSNMKVMHDNVELELRPRFPLFGGWKTNYILGYNVPSFEYIYKSNEMFVLKMRVIDHIYEDMIVEQAVVNVVLPEGSFNIELSTPYAVDRKDEGLFHTYLDTAGRPVLTFSKSSLVENHIADFHVKYNHSMLALLRKPALLIGFIYIIFLVVIIVLRLDFSLASNKHSHQD